MSEHDEGPTESEDGSGGILSPRQRTYLRRSVHGLAILLVIVLVVPFVVYAVPQVVGAEHSYVVLSGSMEPTLSPGDVTVVDAVDPAAVENGDIITYLREGESRTTTHRVVEVVEQDGEPAFRTKGDNNEDPDQGVVTAGQLRGRVMTVGGTLFVLPFAGYVIQFANTQTGFSLLFVVPLVLLVANEIWNVVSSARRDSDDPTSSESEPVLAEEPVGAEPTEETTDSTGDGGVSFRPAELLLSVLVLGAFALYSAGMAAVSPGVWTIGVAASVVAGFFLLGGLYVRGRLAGDGESDGSGEHVAGDDVIIESGPPHATDDAGQRESVASLAALVDLAGATGARIRRTPADGTYSLPDGETLYVFAPGGDGDEARVGDVGDAVELAPGRDEPGPPETGGDPTGGADTVDETPSEADDD